MNKVEDIEMSFQEYKKGELVWSKLRGHPWWPSMVVCHLDIRQMDPGPNHRWVKWFGETRHSRVGKTSMMPFYLFCEYFSDAKFLRDEAYRCAAYEALLIAACRAGLTFSLTESIDDTCVTSEQQEEGEENLQSDTTAKSEMKKSIHQECKDMVAWAKGGFLPNGPPSIQPVADIEEHFSREDSGDAMDSTIDDGTVECKGKMLDKVRKGLLQLKDLCVRCGVGKVVIEHPLVNGGLCHDCKVAFKESAFVYEMDGYQAFCSVCCEGTQMIICDNRNCSRSFCTACMDSFDGPVTSEQARKENPWLCYMCRPACTGLLQRREDWPARLFDIFATERTLKQYSTPQLYFPISADDRKPIRVLSLFDGIAAGKVALEQLGFKVETYYASEIDEDAISIAKVQHSDIRHVGDVSRITDQNLDEWGPFDLLIGGSPCNDLSLANPNRRGIYHPRGTGILFFHYYRILEELMERSEGRCFFWLYENVSSMRTKDKTVICRFLKCDPLTLDAYDFTAAHRARCYWGNLPAMDRPCLTTASKSMELDGCLTGVRGSSRKTTFTKIRTVTTRFNSLEQGKARQLPVSMEENPDRIWSREMETVFGFPTHYTEHRNLSTARRQQLLGKSWSVPVIKHLLSPLKEYFASGKD